MNETLTRLDKLLLVASIVLFILLITMIIFVARDLGITPEDPPRMDDTTTMFNPDTTITNKYQVVCDPPCTGCKNSLEERPEPHFPKAR